MHLLGKNRKKIIVLIFGFSRAVKSMKNCDRHIMFIQISPNLSSNFGKKGNYQRNDMSLSGL